MTTVLRPLSTGELLDRTFSLYRSHFGLFVGIFALPHLAVLAFQFIGISVRPPGRQLADIMASMGWVWGAVLLSMIFSAVSQAATVVAVSEVHLGRSASVLESFQGEGATHRSCPVVAAGVCRCLRGLPGANHSRHPALPDVVCRGSGQSSREPRNSRLHVAQHGSDKGKPRSNLRDMAYFYCAECRSELACTVAHSHRGWRQLPGSIAAQPSPVAGRISGRKFYFTMPGGSTRNHRIFSGLL